MAELTIEVSPEEARPQLEKAAKELSSRQKIEGFRPGKASYDTVKTRFGETAIYEEALPDIVRKSYVQAVKENELRAFGEPTINVTKMAAGNPVCYTATVALVPQVLSMPDLKKIKVKPKEIKIEDKEVEESVRQLQKMQTKEARVNREARSGDKIIVDMDLSQGGVTLEGGQARDHSVYLDEEYYIPGFEDQVLGLKEGEKKKFTLKFPTEHFQKHLAGQDVDFEVTLKGIFELIHPELNDEFAKSLGQESMDGLRVLLRGNIEQDAREKERQRVEIEILERIAEKSRFEEIPDQIANAEVERMLHELKHDINNRGLEFEDYLKSIKKTLAELKLDFAPQAIKRIKTALLLREIGLQEKIDAEDQEVMAEIQEMMNRYSENAEVQGQLRSDEYQDYVRTSLRNRKVLEFLRQTVLEK
ncbi:hypothetical protein AMJ57_05525 [Parcubacteria bacterium SG8_24]|nr:MAG: hypothetical protein AMJ57_05525 [Parcubacteria bacterium SG8_24]